MVAPLVAVGAGLAAGGVAGSLFGGKKIKKPDITQQLAQVNKQISTSRGRVDQLYDQLQPLTQRYQTGAEDVIGQGRATADEERNKFLSSTSELATQAKDALRQNLYSDTFAGLPDTLRAVREASAAGSGIDSGAYQAQVGNIGRDVARNLTTGERDIQIAGLEGQQNAQQVAYQTFSNLSSKLDDQQLDLLAKVMDTGREDMIRRTAGQLGLDEAETQAIISLLNFRESGQMAADSAEASNRQALYNALIGGGSMMMGKGGK